MPREARALTVVAPEAPPSSEDLAVWADGALSVADAAQFCALGRSRLYELMGSGALKWRNVGRRRLIARRSLVALLAGQNP